MKYLVLLCMSILLIQNIQGLSGAVKSHCYNEYFDAIQKIDPKLQCKKECIKPTYAAEKSNNDFIEAEAQFKAFATCFEKIKKGLDKDLDQVCANKKDVKKYYGDKYRDDHAAGNSHKHRFLEISITASLKDNINKDKDKKKKKEEKKKQATKSKEKFGLISEAYKDLDKYGSCFKGIFSTTLHKNTEEFLKCCSLFI